MFKNYFLILIYKNNNSLITYFLCINNFNNILNISIDERC